MESNVCAKCLGHISGRDLCMICYQRCLVEISHYLALPKTVRKMASVCSFCLVESGKIDNILFFISITFISI